MLGNFQLSKSFDKFSKKKKDTPHQLSGILGLSTAIVQVPNRDGYVYVRLRDNQNEVIVAYNDAVAPVFGLPIIVEWDITRYTVIGRDLERYALWGTSAPYLPLHGGTHSFSDWGQGGDVTWVYSRQFMPLLAVPSGSYAGNSAIVYPYVYQYDDTWKYLSVTGTPSLVGSLPTGGSNAKMGLLYLDRRNNILGVDFSGSEFLGSITGTSAVLQHLPQPSSIHYLPIAGVRVVTGTYTIGWQNLYDVRPLFGGGGGGGGGGLVGFTDGSIIFAEGEQETEDNDNFFYDNTNNAILVRDNSSALVDSTIFLRALAESSLGQIIASVGASVTSFLGLYRARGTIASPEAVQSGDVLGRIYFNGHDGTGWQSKARFDAKATENWSGAARGTEIEIRTTAIGEVDTEKAGSWKGHGLELVKALQTGNLVTVTNTYNTTRENCIVLADWSGASGTFVDITLHAPTYTSQILYIKRLDDPDYSTVNINAGDGDTIDGNPTVYLSTQYDVVVLVADGVDTWNVFSSSITIAQPDTITENTTNSVAGGLHTHALDVSELTVDNIIVENSNAEIGIEILGLPGQTEPNIRMKPSDFGNTAYAGFTSHNALFLGSYDTQSLNAASQINSDRPSYVKITGNGSAVTLTSDPQITTGEYDGQIIMLEGTNSANPVTISNGQGLHLRSRIYTLYEHDWIMLIWHDNDGLWMEMNRSSPSQEQTWAFKSFHISGTSVSLGTSYAMGFYRHATGADTFNPSKTFGYSFVAQGAKVYFVLGQDAVDELTIRVTGAQIQPDGTSLIGQAEDIVIPADALTDDYFETTTYWVGSVALTYISGTEKPCNYGFVRAWNNSENEFRVTGLTATWFSRDADSNVDLRLYHHRASGWSAQTGSIASPPAAIASMKDDYGDYDRSYTNEYGSWYRDNLSSLIVGPSEGLIFAVRSEYENSFSLGNITLRYRPAW